MNLYALNVKFPHCSLASLAVHFKQKFFLETWLKLAGKMDFTVNVNTFNDFLLLLSFMNVFFSKPEMFCKPFNSPCTSTVEKMNWTQIKQCV